MENEQTFIPKWHRELEIFTQVKPIIIFDGNVLDVYQYPVDGSTPQGSIIRLAEYLYYHFKDTGYKNIAFYDSTVGFYNRQEPEMVDHFAECVQAKTSHGVIQAAFRGTQEGSASQIVYRALSQNQVPTVVIMDMASRYISSPDNLSQEEVDAYSIIVKASLEAKEVRCEGSVVLKNLLIVVVNKLNDLPAWFYLQNPNVKAITIDPPSVEERESLVKGVNFWLIDRMCGR